ncbi:MAG: HPr family phosphocarrier protein [Phycisphaerales bacterium]
MPTIRVAISNRLGLHARPATAFAQAAGRFKAAVRVRRAETDEWVDGKSIMQMLMLAATAGTILEIEANGADGDAATKELKALVERHFDED